MEYLVYMSSKVPIVIHNLYNVFVHFVLFSLFYFICVCAGYFVSLTQARESGRRESQVGIASIPLSIDKSRKHCLD